LPDTEPGTQPGAQPEFLLAETPRGTVTAAPIPGANVGTEADEMATPSRGQLRMAARRFVRHKMAMTGAIIFLVLLLGSIIVPMFWQYSYSTITNSFATGPSAAHPFGTDLIGHDMLAQVMAGTLTSMEVALLVAAISTVIGTIVGALAGYYGGIIDQALMRLTDLVLVVPLIAILLVLSNKFSKQANGWVFVALLLALLTYYLSVRRLQSSRAVREE
jgi:ABC-type dipeptide/oligopeptide/nickel transport system permease subunit